MSGPPNTILVEPADGQQRVIEKLAVSATTPGNLLLVDASDEFDLSTDALASAAKLFALENVADAGGIDDDYAVGDRLRALYSQPGDMVNAIAIVGSTIVIGAPLESGALGTVQALTTGTLIGHAASAVTASSAGDRILVRVA